MMPIVMMLTFFIVGEPHVEMLGAYFWFYAQGIFLVGWMAIRGGSY